MNAEQAGRRIAVRGIVQGVGFRPFLYNLAGELGLTGWVRNTSGGVELEVHGPAEAVRQFETRLRSDAPPLAQIDDVFTAPAGGGGYMTFTIEASQPQEGDFLPVSPDAAICPACQAELFDPANRRYRYPFINCTHCGPRFTIIEDIPYDRPKTTMAGFALCPACAAEYADPRDRRFHAQPVACPACGPQVWLEAGGVRAAEGEAALQAARAALQAGQIVAVKGLGGFHLACDAHNATAVAALRQRKQRSEKPFAVMAFSPEIAGRYCILGETERALLEDRTRPVVLLERRADAGLPAELAPGQRTLGVMLAYTPLHLLLLEPAPGFPDLLVMTSGNLSDEPIAYTNEDARQRLAPLADLFLMHDRPIHMRVDDSVVRPSSAGEVLVRRARGYAPHPVLLPRDVPPLLAAGAELKSAVCLARGPYAFLSHYIGDLENYETYQSFVQAVEHYQRLFRVTPRLLAADLHPDYLATRYAVERAQAEGLPLVRVQHHHAHLAACLADNGCAQDEPVIGLTWDGTGLGTDGTIWGGEVLVGGYRAYRRAFTLEPTPLPGGDAAVRKPARMALAHLAQAGLEWEPDLPPAQALCYDERTLLRSQIAHHINTPLTSSMGRLFDAAAALIGVRETVNYEGQAAMELEAAADPDERGAYPFDLRGAVFSPAPMWQNLLDDWRAGTPTAVLAARFHNSLVRLALELCQRLRQAEALQTVALSGGVWQNRRLLEGTVQTLEAVGFRVLRHRRLPPNDGCIALGQALVAAHSLE